MATPETFLARGLRVFRGNVGGWFRRASEWRTRSVEAAERRLIGLAAWQSDNKWGVIIGLGVLIWLGLTGWFALDWSRGRVAGNAVQTGVGGMIGGAIVGLIVSPIIAAIVYVALLILNKLIQILVPLVLFLPLLAAAPVYAVWQVIVIAGKLLLLLPLSVLVIGTRVAQLWRGIFYTCPSRGCAYRGLPIYVCADCGHGNPFLWPNLYGLFYHHCAGCDRRLPALGSLGRGKLDRRCGGCEVPLIGRHAGKARERLVAIVGAPASGKTNYLLMTTAGLLANQEGIRAEIDEPAQQTAFDREWTNLQSGMPAAKTSEVLHALLLYAHIGTSRCQLYLYDAPGEEFATIGSMTRQQYVPLLEGFILLVDPLAFDAVQADLGQPAARVSLQEVVTSTLVHASSGLSAGKSGKLKPRVAVVISKADLEPVRRAIGKGTNAECRRAIASWGGENALRAIELKFESVEYFACSPLGRDAAKDRGKPFKATGVLEPLRWVLGEARA